MQEHYGQYEFVGHGSFKGFQYRCHCGYVSRRYDEMVEVKFDRRVHVPPGR